MIAVFPGRNTLGDSAPYFYGAAERGTGEKVLEHWSTEEVTRKIAADC